MKYIFLLSLIVSTSVYSQNSDSTNGSNLNIPTSTQSDTNKINAAAPGQGSGIITGPIGYMNVTPPQSGCRTVTFMVTHYWAPNPPKAGRGCSRSSCISESVGGGFYNIFWRVNGVKVSPAALFKQETGCSGSDNTCGIQQARGLHTYTSSSQICAGTTQVRFDFPDYNNRNGDGTAIVTYKVN